jgi:hypothetical protein
MAAILTQRRLGKKAKRDQRIKTAREGLYSVRTHFHMIVTFALAAIPAMVFHRELKHFDKLTHHIPVYVLAAVGAAASIYAVGIRDETSKKFQIAIALFLASLAIITYLNEQ